MTRQPTAVTSALLYVIVTLGMTWPLAGDLKAFDQRTTATFPFTPPFNMTGQPSISLPIAQSATGLPIGMMFTARYGDEATLFRLAAQLEQARPWAERRPAIWG